jgi:hypothetical protein
MSKIYYEPVKRILSQSDQPRWERIATLVAILFILQSSILMFQCGVDVENPTPPSAPVWVEKSLPEEWPEHGIDAYVSARIFLEWEENIEKDITVYHIYRAEWINEQDKLGEYHSLVQIEMDLINETSFIDQTAQTRVKYYYKIVAEDISGIESKDSDHVFYTLLPSIGLSLMSPNGLLAELNSDRELTWRYDYGIEMENYIITIISQGNEFVLRSIVQPGNYVGVMETWQIPSEIVLLNGQTYFWRVDIGAGYQNSFETMGSESQWAKFLYIEN